MSPVHVLQMSPVHVLQMSPVHVLQMSPVHVLQMSPVHVLQMSPVQVLQNESSPCFTNQSSPCFTSPVQSMFYNMPLGYDRQRVRLRDFYFSNPLLQVCIRFRFGSTAFYSKTFSVQNRTLYKSLKQDEFDFKWQTKICNKKPVGQKRRRIRVCRKEFENLITVLVFVAEVKSIVAILITM